MLKTKKWFIRYQLTSTQCVVPYDMIQVLGNYMSRSQASLLGVREVGSIKLHDISYYRVLLSPLV